MMRVWRWLRGLDVTAGLWLAPLLAGLLAIVVLTAAVYYQSFGLAVLLFGAWLLSVGGWVWRDVIARRQQARLRVALATERALHEADMAAQVRRFDDTLERVRYAQAVTALMQNSRFLEEAQRSFNAGAGSRGAA